MERIRKLPPPPTTTVKRDYLSLKAKLPLPEVATRSRPAAAAVVRAHALAAASDDKKVAPASTVSTKKKTKNLPLPAPTCTSAVTTNEDEEDDDDNSNNRAAPSPSGAFSIRVHAERLLGMPPNAGECGEAFVRFNHYNKPFPVKNLVLQWSDVDEEYSFSFVYKGRKYRREIFECLPPAPVPVPGPGSVEGGSAGSEDPATATRRWGAKMGRDEQGDYFLGLKPNGQYLVTVVEEEGEGESEERGRERERAGR